MFSRPVKTSHILIATFLVSFIAVNALLQIVGGKKLFETLMPVTAPVVSVPVVQPPVAPTPGARSLSVTTPTKAELTQICETAISDVYDTNAILLSSVTDVTNVYNTKEATHLEPAQAEIINGEIMLNKFNAEGRIVTSDGTFSCHWSNPNGLKAELTFRPGKDMIESARYSGTEDRLVKY